MGEKITEVILLQSKVWLKLINIIINVKESVPAPNSMVTQGITYPFCVVKINSKKKLLLDKKKPLSLVVFFVQTV
jgi:hypothetical protein